MVCKRLSTPFFFFSSILLLLFSCGRKSPHASLDVVNGRHLLDSDFPSVVMLFDTERQALCSGTFISRTLVLTAAHCAGSRPTDAKTLKVNAAIKLVEKTGEILPNGLPQLRSLGVAKNFYRHPQWQTIRMRINAYDLAIVEFEPSLLYPVEILEISKQQAGIGDEMEVVGYGSNAQLRQGTGMWAQKRVGVSRIEKMEEGLIRISGPKRTTHNDPYRHKNSSAANGDSGGPLLKDGKIYGVVSGGTKKNFFRLYTNYVDLHSQTSKDFLSKFGL